MRDVETAISNDMKAIIVKRVDGGCSRYKLTGATGYDPPKIIYAIGQIE